MHGLIVAFALTTKGFLHLALYIALGNCIALIGSLASFCKRKFYLDSSAY